MVAQHLYFCRPTFEQGQSEFTEKELSVWKQCSDRRLSSTAKNIMNSLQIKT
jgi:hypothetical protein